MTGEKAVTLPVWPDERGYFGSYGGQFVPETLVPALRELESLYASAKNDGAFNGEFLLLLREFAGRPTPLTFARRLTSHYGGGRIYLKREDLCHTGAHKINHTSLWHASVQTASSSSGIRSMTTGRCGSGAMAWATRMVDP